MGDAKVRQAAVVSIDVLIAAVSLILAVNLRITGHLDPWVSDGLKFAVPLFVVIAATVFHLCGLYRRVWRYTSLSDILVVVQAATLSICILLGTLILMDRIDWMPRSIPVIHWFILVVMMGGARMARRMFCEFMRAGSVRPHLPVQKSWPRQLALLVGPCDRVDMVLRLLENSADAQFHPVGVLDDSGSYVRMKLRGVPILGSTEALPLVVKQLEAKGLRPQCLIVTESPERLRGSAMVQLVTEAESLGLKVASVPKLAEVSTGQLNKLDLSFINMAELLGRPQTVLDNEAVCRAIAGRRVLVTGAGGTIGSELVRQIAALQPAQLILLDNSEFNLYSIDLELKENHPQLARVPVLCSIRQRPAVMQVFSEHRPELVFHAAALKHVPLVEAHPCAGVQTNVIGTKNVADAARKYGVQAMVQVSTDKAVNPVGLMGATKRLGELYCQALDLEGQGDDDASRFLTVRFGNVIGSSGSLIPLFQRQLSRGGPLTVTHPDIERYFMTVHEAVQLILQSTARAMVGGVRRGRIFVLDMGDPVKIMDVARRMIRLAGLEPDVDVKIDIVGLRPGEKLYEELFDENERRLPSVIPGIFEAEPSAIPLSVLNESFSRLAKVAGSNDAAEARALVRQIVDGDIMVEANDISGWTGVSVPAETASHAA